MAVEEVARSNRGAAGVIASVALAMIASGGLLALRRFVRGTADPFEAGWPIELQLTSLVATAAIGYCLRHPFFAAVGTYAGLLLFLFMTGASEYPVSSAIALAVHGLIPALIGGLVAAGLLRVGRA